MARKKYCVQSLCFCVRDFKSPEDFPFGKEGGKRYMDQVLNVCFFALNCFVILSQYHYRHHLPKRLNCEPLDLKYPHLSLTSPASCFRILVNVWQSGDLSGET